MTSPAQDISIRTLSLTDSEVRFYQEEGYLSLPGVLSPEMVDAVSQEVFAALEANGVSRASLSRATSAADKLRQCGDYLAGTALDRLINSPEVRGLASRLVGGQAYRYMPFTAVKAGGGGGAFHFHQDNNYTPHDPASGSINIWVALVDMTPENGCLQIVPRSHREGQLKSRNSDDGDTHQQVEVDPLTCLPIRLRAGDAVAFTRWTVHGSGPNHTNEPRVAYALQFHREDVRWLDRATGKWARLLDQPRFQTGPVAKLGART